MTTTTVNSAHYVAKWARDIYREYIRESGFMPYMKGSNNVIVPKRQLVEGGQTINVPFSPKLSGAGVTGQTLLRGNEEAMAIHNEQVQVDWFRHAVEATKRDANFVAFDLYATAKDQIKDWFINEMRRRIIEQFLSVRNSTGSGANSAYGTITQGTNGPEITAADYSATETEKDGWIARNTDRILCGKVRSNVNSNSSDHSAALATLDTTDDTMRSGIISLAKRMAKQASPAIRPIRVADTGEEYFVLFCNTRAFRDAAADSTISQANRDARPRVVSENPIFTGGELIYDGVIIKEIPEIPILTNAGSGAAVDVAPCFLAGQQAMAYALGQDMTPVSEETDYQFRKGVGAEECSAFKKIHYNGKQHGVVTVYVAAAADS